MAIASSSPYQHCWPPRWSVGAGPASADIVADERRRCTDDHQERPHQALGGAYPAEIYTPSARPYEPSHDPD